MIVKYLLAIFLFGQEASAPPTVVQPFSESRQCHVAAAEANAEIKAAGGATVAYAACLKIEHGQPV